MKPKSVRGNIFTTQCQTIVNTVNCVGVMGAGIALECRLRFPKMFEKYVALCANERIRIGQLWLYNEESPWILNFPTKQHWKLPTKEEYLHRGLESFMSSYQELGITSIAFPMLGAQSGGLDPARSLQVMESYLTACTVPVEIYSYDPKATDDLYLEIRRFVLENSVDEVRSLTGLRADAVLRLKAAMGDSSICQVNQLARVDGIGDKTLEKLFRFRLPTSTSRIGAQQQSLDI